MSVDFNDSKCQDQTSKELFGICDDRPGQRAYINTDKKNGKNWIAVVINELLYNVTFTAIDKCVETKKSNGKMDKRCDGFLNYNSVIIFIELKERSSAGNNWIKDGEEQLRTSIKYFENNSETPDPPTKKAYIANNMKPKFRSSQTARMEKFFIETNYILRIENRIILE